MFVENRWEILMIMFLFLIFGLIFFIDAQMVPDLQPPQINITINF
ncbi:hypothetical protein [Persephonella sp.]